MADNDRPERPESSAVPPSSDAQPPAPGDAPSSRANVVEQPRMGAFARVLSVFVSPGAVFADIARKPSVTLALILLTSVGVGTQAVVISHLDVGATIRERIAKSGRQIPDAQMDKAVAMGSKFKWVGLGVSVVATPAVFALLGLVFWLGIKLMGSDTGYLRVFSTVVHAFLPAAVVSGVLVAILASRAGMLGAEAVQGLVKSNLGAFLPASTGPVVHAVAASVDVFTLWSLVLLAIGLSVVGHLKQARATILVGGLWLVYVAGHVGIVALRHAFA